MIKFNITNKRKQKLKSLTFFHKFYVFSFWYFRISHTHTTKTHKDTDTVDNRITEILRIATEKLFVNNKCLNDPEPLFKFSEILFCKHSTDSRNQLSSFLTTEMVKK